MAFAIFFFSFLQNLNKNIFKNNLSKKVFDFLIFENYF